MVDGLDVAQEGREVRRRVAFAFTDPAAQLVMPTVVEDVALSLRRRHPDRDNPPGPRARCSTAYGLGRPGRAQRALALRRPAAAARDCRRARDRPRGPRRGRAHDAARPRQPRRVADLLFSLQQQLLLVTRDLDLALRCDRALLLDGGRVMMDGDPARRGHRPLPGGHSVSHLMGASSPARRPAPDAGRREALGHGRDQPGHRHSAPPPPRSRCWPRPSDCSSSPGCDWRCCCGRCAGCC